MSTTKNHIEIAATEYLMRGFSVIPLRDRDKRPTLSSWEPYKTQRADWEEIERWFKVPKNIGIVTGAVSGIVVLDIDGPEGEEALAAIQSMHGDLPETWISSTGKGRHFLFQHPGTEIRNSASRQLSIDFRGDGGYIVAPPSIHPTGAEYRWTHHSEQEIAPAPAWLVEWMTADKQPAWVDQVLVELGRIKQKPEKNISANPEKQKSVILENQKTSAKNILKSCAFCQHCRDNATDLSEPEWHAMVTNIGRVSGGPELVHELSKPHAGYKESETESKIQHAIKNGEPHSCDYIQNRIGFTGCPPDGCGVKAPVVFGTSEIHLSQAELDSLLERLRMTSDPSQADILAAPIIDALATLKRRDVAQFTIYKSYLKDVCKKLDLRALESLVKTRVDEQKQIKLAERKQEALEANQKLSIKVDCGFEITMPDDWSVNDAGVHIIKEDGLVRILPVMLYMTKRIYNADTGEEKVQLSYYRDKFWRHISVQRPVAFNRSQITSLSVHALPVTSENAKDVINYLSDFEAQHMELIPVVRSVSRMGWVGNNHFMPGAAGGIELDVEQGMTAIANGYEASGDLQTWLTCMREARQSPLVRLLMAASFAAPLLKHVGHRVFLVHVWGPSRGGKTAGLKAALSIWGDPDTIMASFNSTKVGLERLASLFCDLPLGVDERQIVGNKQDMLDSLVYLIGMGKGKTRGTKGGGLQATAQWRTIALTTGEEPLSGESSNTGIRTRALEVYGQPFADEKVAANVHQISKDHHGTAGQEYIQSIIQAVAHDSEQFKLCHQMLVEQIQKTYSKHMGATISQLAMLALGDICSSDLIFKDKFPDAVEQALNLVSLVAASVSNEQDADEAVIAAYKFMSWIRSNHSFFDRDSHIMYGFQMDGAIHILSHVFDKTIAELGFNPNRMLRDWAKRDWIRTVHDGEKVRYRQRIWDKKIGARVDCIVFVGPKNEELSTEFE